MTGFFIGWNSFFAVFYAITGNHWVSVAFGIAAIYFTIVAIREENLKRQRRNRHFKVQDLTNPVTRKKLK